MHNSYTYSWDAHSTHKNTEHLQISKTVYIYIEDTPMEEKKVHVFMSTEIKEEPKKNVPGSK